MGPGQPGVAVLPSAGGLPDPKPPASVVNRNLAQCRLDVLRSRSSARSVQSSPKVPAAAEDASASFPFRKLGFSGSESVISKHKAVLPEQRPDAVPEEAPPPAAAPEGNWQWVAMPIEYRPRRASSTNT